MVDTWSIKPLADQVLAAAPFLDVDFTNLLEAMVLPRQAYATD